MFKAKRLPVLRLSLLALILLGFSRLSNAGGPDDVVKAFEKNPDYVRPFATLFGTATNSGWYQSAAVAKIFGFYIGMPLNIARLADADRSFKTHFTDSGCVTFHQHHPGGTGCTEVTRFTTPTIFGRSAAQTMHTSYVDTGFNLTGQTTPVEFSDGVAAMADFNWFPFGIPQLGFSFMNTEVKLRYIGLPLSMFSFSMPGFGVQHDFSSFLPPLPVSVSAAANFSWLSAEWKPDDQDIQGTLKLDGFSYFSGVLVGYTYARWVEVFMEAGWEGASLHSGGSLVLSDTTGGKLPETVKPNLDISGRNGFRAALNVAIHFGYDAVLGQNLGAEFGNQASILGFRLK